MHLKDCAELICYSNSEQEKIFFDLENYFSKFESKWADIIANRIKTKVGDSMPSKKGDYETFKPTRKPIGL